MPYFIFTKIQELDSSWDLIDTFKNSLAATMAARRYQQTVFKGGFLDISIIDAESEAEARADLGVDLVDEPN